MSAPWKAGVARTTSAAMDRISAMKAFVRVVDTGSLSEAARQLGLSKSAVGKQVGALESLVGRPLLHRSTRAVRPSQEGEALLERCRRLVQEVEALGSGAAADPGLLAGHLRLSAPASFAALFLADALTGFLARHPAVTLELLTNDRIVDPVREGFDLVFHGQDEPKPSLIARAVCPLRRVVCAAPAHVALHGAPESPAALAAHPAIQYSLMPTGTAWVLENGGRRETVRVRPHLSSDSGAVMLRAALAGTGVALLPTLLAAEALKEGRLVRLLPGWEAERLAIHAVYPTTHRGNPRIRALLDFLATRLDPLPPWDRDIP